ncbi:MAG: hypothetical protein PWP15_1259 [Methanothermococcus sp.]|jgi:hypothetical protein|uniref:hypothetical protein n=1 Tax=Methanothermococcus TaxID=155862 RepID=UPI0003704F7C|nr:MULTISPECIES: hypothetical protein [Methanothermococcus]MDK2790752.1 hypothetical protein [Methanothermococcus sp.]MDK2987881.1 hypothetical protein [Methanothermococcus sp.]
MYKLKKIDEINEVDEKVALIGKVVNILGGVGNHEKVELEDETGSILISKRSYGTSNTPNNENIEFKVGNVFMVLGTSKLTPKGINIFVDIFLDLNDTDPELLACFRSKFEGFADSQNSSNLSSKDKIVD